MFTPPRSRLSICAPFHSTGKSPGGCIRSSFYFSFPISHEQKSIFISILLVTNLKSIKVRIDVNRFYAICKPFDYDHFMNTYSAMGMIAAAWLFPTFISFVPIFLGWYATDKHLEVRSQKPLYSIMIDARKQNIWQ